jgi:hypothetical protein
MSSHFGAGYRGVIPSLARVDWEFDFYWARREILFLAIFLAAQRSALLGHE